MLVEHLKAQNDIRRYLSDRGFKELDLSNSEEAPSTLQFIGLLSDKCWNEKVTIKISDWNFISFPKICVLSQSSFITPPTAHIAADGGICYAVEGSVILNPLYPINAVAFCIDTAEKLLISLKENKEKEKEDYEREFFSIWGEFLAFSIDLIDTSQIVEFISAKKHSTDTELLFIQNQNSEFDTLQALNFEELNKFIGTCIKISENFYIRSYEPPRTLGEMIRFARQIGAEFCYQLYDAFRVMFSSQNSSSIYFIVISAQNGFFGFFFNLNDIKPKNKDDAKKLIAWMKNPSHPVSKTLITRMNILNYKNEEIFSRNKQPNLKNKRILLIGAGSIGGYLADVLTRLGGGFSGELCIVDKENLYPENIGRHRLGMNNVFCKKASGLANQLSQEFPYSNITFLDEDIFKSLSFDWDLIIDATGDERTSRTINRLHQKALSKEENICPILYCWIAGQGEAWQTLWVGKEQENACWECLFMHSDDGGRTLRDPIITDPQPHLEVGCKALTPYASTASMSIAALTGEVIIDWLNGNPSPNFRIRERTSAKINSMQDTDLPAKADCPVCQK